MSATLWHDPMTDEWTIKDGDHAETISPFVRQAMIDEHERLAKELDRECDEWSHAYDRLKAENAKLREWCSELLKMAERHDPEWLHWPEIHDELRKLGVKIVKL